MELHHPRQHAQNQLHRWNQAASSVQNRNVSVPCHGLPEKETKRSIDEDGGKGFDAVESKREVEEVLACNERQGGREGG
ncbi:progesterone-induced-blocking factor 1 isoform X1 [Sesbania bispinosa]|nr:progesterone-induced-blocking factor 1 isoform X1 [Sesbania bispinosa]